jgi:hypothetical protein
MLVLWCWFVFVCLECLGTLVPNGTSEVRPTICWLVVVLVCLLVFGLVLTHLNCELPYGLILVNVALSEPPDWYACSYVLNFLAGPSMYVLMLVLLIIKLANFMNAGFCHDRVLDLPSKFVVFFCAVACDFGF